MRVLVLTPHLYIEGKKSFEHNKTGFSIMLLKIVEGLVEVGVDVSVLTQTSRTKGFDWKGANFNKFTLLDMLLSVKPIYIKLALKMIKKLPGTDVKSVVRILYWCLTGAYVEKLIKRDRADVVNIHSTMAPTVPLLLACSRVGVKIIFTIHAVEKESQNVSANTPFRSLFYRYQKLAAAKGIPMTTVSEGVKKQLLIIRGQDDDDNIYVVGNGTDFIDRPSLSKINVREKYNIATEQKIALYVGSICETKNQIQLIRALSMIDKSILKKIKVLLLGENKMGNAIYKDLEQYGLKDYVEICGFVKREDLTAYYQQSDFNILLSISEGFGLSIIEARIFGLPTLTFADMGAVVDIFDPTCMHLVKDRKDGTLARELEHFFTFYWNKKEIKERSKGFSLKDIGAKYLNVYNSVVQSNFSSNDVFSLLD